MEKQQMDVRQEEQEHLNEIQKEIKEQLQVIDVSLDKTREDIMKQKRYLWENIYELDLAEIASNRVIISENHDSYEFRENQKRLLSKLWDNPYFGRIDFVYDGECEAEVLYIGLGGLRNKNGFDTLIYDWRAPISSMYYDFDIGNAYYEAPMGRIDGEILQKRQLKIRKGVLEYVLNSDFKVDDEILQKELSGNGSTKMRNIVATIQKEQNSIVRDQTSSIMLVQGVAGSGKTSIALHRIAFLLYQNRKNLLSSEILIISPNNIFADYISNVLPELGEQNISEVSFDEIAQHEMDGFCKFETKYAQMEYIIGCKSEEAERLQRIRFKDSFVFLSELQEYVTYLENKLLTFSSCTFNNYTMDEEKIRTLYQEAFASEPMFMRLDMIGDRIADIYESDYHTVVSVSSRNEIKQKLYEMARTKDFIELYSEFIESLKEKYPVMKSDFISEKSLMYEDVFPVVLLKFMLFGKQSAQFDRIKHVIVDEMQDYSMVQYELLHILFNSNMTILGDINQVVDKGNETVLDNVQKVFGQEVTIVKMLKSYRSTYEISEFCRKLCNLTDAESFERHGKAPVIEECRDYNDMVASIQNRMDNVNLSEVTTLVTICKTSLAAQKLYDALDEKHKERCYLMNKEDADFREGIIITNSYLVKGLEFDHVIVPEVTCEEYFSERDRQVLYIAGTRALHELDILFFGRKSSFLDIF